VNYIHKQIRKDRESGLTLEEIATKYGKVKSTISVICKGIKLSAKAKATLEENRKKPRTVFSWASLAPLRADLTDSLRSGVECPGVAARLAELSPAVKDRLLQWSISFIQKENSDLATRKRSRSPNGQPLYVPFRYNERDKAIADILENHFGVSGLRKERLEDIFIMYCNDTHIIEVNWSNLSYKTYRTVKHFAYIASMEDTRKRICVCTLSPHHKDYGRLVDRFNVEVVPLGSVFDLSAGTENQEENLNE
jgi:hypothetical protein